MLSMRLCLEQKKEYHLNNLGIIQGLEYVKNFGDLLEKWVENFTR